MGAILLAPVERVGVIPGARLRTAGARRSRAAARFAATYGAVVAVVVGALWFVVVSSLHDRWLERDVYLEALAESGASRRLYSEVLADGATREIFEQSFAGLTAVGIHSSDVSAVVAASLRLALPPEVLEVGAAALVSGVQAYLRGDHAVLHAPLPVLATLDQVDPAAARVVRALVIDAPDLLLAHLDAIESYVRSVARGMATGHIPETVPFVGGIVVARRDITETLDGFLPSWVPQEVRAAIISAVESPAPRGSHLSAALGGLHASLQRLSDRLASGGDIEIDLVAVIELVSGHDEATLQARLEPVRSAMRWLPSASRYLGPALVLGGGFVLVWRHRSRPPLGALLIGATLASAGLAVSSGWAVLQRLVDDAVSGAVTSDGGGVLPNAAQRLLTDLDDVLLAEVSHSWNRPASTLLAIGLLVAATGAISLLWSTTAGHRRRRLIGALAAIAATAVALPVTAHRGEVTAERLCNGRRELCDRRYDEIVQLATHNAMSSPDVVRVWPEHDGNIAQQLRFGVRTLMIDVAYWRRLDDTALEPLRRLTRAGSTSGLAELVESALAPRPGTYLCHNVCALGAIRLTDALAEIRGFLDSNPNEVVTLIIQDGVDPADVEAAFVDSGLEDRLYQERPGRDWPTMAELVDSGERLVVFSEQHVVRTAWYLNAFERIQDTSYGARTPAELTCAPNRGPPDATLFLLNHWIERPAPDRGAAAVVNAKEFIVERARRCAEQRGRMPNYIAVSFYDIGDARGAVDELNGLAPATSE